MAPLAAPICRRHGDRLRRATDAAKPPPVAAAAGVFVAPATIDVIAIVAAAAAEGVGGEWEAGGAWWEGHVKGTRRFG